MKIPLFESLWADYSRLNPQAGRIHGLFTDQGETIVNDHIALRTFDHPKLNIESLARHFNDLGYVERDEYFFEAKNLRAKYYSGPEPDSPKVFISELIAHKHSLRLQKMIASWVEGIDSQRISDQKFLISGIHWPALAFSEYEAIRKESEYAAWLACFGFRVNHFTVSLNHFIKFSTIQDANIFLKKNGFILNGSGGEIKGSPAEGLMQSSTKAENVGVRFSDGMHPVPSCYYEFAQRFPDETGNLFQGFLPDSADKIFESTDPNP